MVENNASPKILFLAMTGLYPIITSGPGIFLFGLINDLSKNGIRGEVFTIPKRKNFSNNQINNFSIYTWSPSRSFWVKLCSYFQFYVLALLSVIKNRIVVFNSPPLDFFSLSVLIFSKVLRRPTVWIIHGGIFNENEGSSLISKFTLKIISDQITKLITVSESMATDVYFRIRRKPEVILNAIELPAQSLESINMRDRDPIFLFVGRLDPIKDLDTLVRAFAKVVAIFPTSFLILVGTGREEKNIKYLVDKLAIDEHVMFKGFLEGKEKLEVMISSDVLILPSKHESFGLVILEAWSCKLPVIAARVGGIPEIIKDQENGLLFQAGNIDELANCMQRMGDRNIRNKYATEGNKTLRSNFTWQRAGKEYRDLFNILMKIK